LTLAFCATAQARDAAPKLKKRTAHELMAHASKKCNKKKKRCKKKKPVYQAPTQSAPPAPLALGDTEAHSAALNVAYQVYLGDYDATYYGVDGCVRNDTYNVDCYDYEGGYDYYGSYECDWIEHVARSGYSDIALSYRNLSCFYY